MKQFINLDGKTFGVVGGSSGIGEAIVLGVSELGGTVFNLSRRALENSPENLLNNVKNIQIDIRNSDSIAKAIESIDSLDGLVYSAGRKGLSPINTLNEEQLEDVLATNLKGFLFFVKELVKKRKIKTQSSIVVISSIAAHTGTEGLIPYSISKAGLSSTVKVLARELARKKIRVNAISPAMVRTPFFDKEGKEYLDNIEKAVYPLGLGEPNDIAAATVFFLSDKSNFITGTDLIMSGGCTWVL
jgi:NAD(P)-dependent dehydrogenase (short-subunit alcohol dehydrogenase family)